MNPNWPLVPLSKVLHHRKEFIIIDELKTYKLCRVQTKAKGITLRVKKQGLEIKTKKQQVCKAGDFCVAEMDARFGGYGLIPEDLDGAIVSSHYFLYEINENKMNKDFFDLFSKTNFLLNQIDAQGSTNYASIRPDHVLSYQMPLPSIEEQESIVEKIGSINNKSIAVDELRKRQIKDIENLLYSAYVDLTKNCSTEKMSVVAPITRSPVEVEMNGDYPEMGIRSFGKGTFHKPSLKGIDVGTKKLFYIKQGDLMFSNVFAWEGAIAVAKDEDDNRVGSHRFISCVPDKNKVLPYYLCFHFLSPKGMEDIQKASPGGAGRNKTLGLKKLENIEVPIPPIDKQREFEKLLAKTRQMKAHIEASQKELDALFPALLDKAFNGKLNIELTKPQGRLPKSTNPEIKPVQGNLFASEEEPKRTRMGKASIHYKSVSSILTRASGFMADYDYTMNPYSGCSFACSYCYAAFFARDNALKEKWGQWVNVKENALAMLVKKRKRPLRGTSIYLGSVTDPYQPIEKELELTRSLLKELATYHSSRLVIQTRSPLVTRDIDIFKKFEILQINMTITTDSETVRRAFEPQCPSNKVRLKAITRLAQAGIQTCITLTPLLPVEDAETFAKNLKATGVKRFIIQPFHAERGKFVAGTREEAMSIIEQFNWNNQKYQEVLGVMQKHIPNIGIGKEGFAPI